MPRGQRIARRLPVLPQGPLRQSLSAGLVVCTVLGCASQPVSRFPPPAEQPATPSAATHTASPVLVPKPAPPAEIIRTLPGIRVNLTTQEVQIDGLVCIEQGILEYIAVAEGGKTYESLFELRCRPSHLSTALLMAGYVAGGLPPELRGDFTPQTMPATSRPDGAPEIPAPPPDYWQKPGDATRVTLHVALRETDGTWRERGIEGFLVDRKADAAPQSLQWAFTGSFFERDPTSGREFFAADADRSVIALWYDPTALLNLAQDVGNPYRTETAGLSVNRNSLPPKGTPIRLSIRPAGAHSGKESGKPDEQ